jgi:hypothetical protein
MASTDSPKLKQAFWWPKNVTTAKTIHGTDSGIAFNNNNATASVTITLPKAAVGLTAVTTGLAYQFLVASAQNLVIQPVGTDTIRGLAAGAPLTLTTVGQLVQLECIVAGYWEVTNGNVFPDGITVSGGSVTLPNLTVTGNLTVDGSSTFTAPVLINTADNIAALIINDATPVDGYYISLEESGALKAAIGLGPILGLGNAVGDFGILATGNIHIAAGNGATSQLSLSTTGAVTIGPPSSGAALTITTAQGTASDILDLNSTGAVSSRVVWLNSGTAFGYASSALSILGGSNSNTDFCVYAANQLVLSAGAGGEIVTINNNSTQCVSISSGTTLPLLLTTSSSGPWALEITRSDLGNTIHVFNAGTSGSGNGIWYFAETIETPAGIIVGTPPGGASPGNVNVSGGYYVNGVLQGGSSGTFTGTLTGMTAATTGTINYVISNGICTLYAVSNILGTSNTTSMTMTGLPTACQPANGTFVVVGPFESNSSPILGAASTAGSHGSTITFYEMNGNTYSATGFAAANGKGLLAGWSMTYPII